MKYIASVSWGKDSLTMLIRLINDKMPLDEVVFYDTGNADGFYTEYLNGNPFNFLLSVKPLNVIGNIHQNEDLLKGTIKCI